MSKHLSQSASKEFDTMVRQAYQAKGGRIRPTIVQRTSVIGETYNFRRMGQGIASLKTTTQSNVSPMDIDYNLITASLLNYNAAEYTDIFDQATVNFDEKQALAESIAMAIKRREDQIIIDAFTGATLPTSNVLTTKASGTTDKNLGVAAILKAGELLSNANAEGQKYMLISPAMRTSLLNDAKTTQSMYVDVKALVSGELMEFAGFKFIYIESSRQEGGLPTVKTAATDLEVGDRYAIAYVEGAAGIAIGIDMRIEVNYVPEKTSWLTNGVFRAGAAVLDPSGVVKIACRNG